VAQGAADTRCEGRGGREARANLTTGSNLRSFVDAFAQASASPAAAGAFTDFGAKPLVVLTAGTGSDADLIAMSGSPPCRPRAPTGSSTARHMRISSERKGLGRDPSGDPRRGHSDPEHDTAYEVANGEPRVQAWLRWQLAAGGDAGLCDTVRRRKATVW
jgi:hypothetical protein